MVRKIPGLLLERVPGARALRVRDFRLFWLGFVMEVSGQQMLWVAQGWLIYELTGSAIYLGLAGLARAVPAIILTFFGGVIADRTDQRRLLLAIQLLQFSLLLALATLTLLGVVHVWHLLVIVSISAAAQSFENPARQAIFPRLIERSALMHAVALNSTVHPGARFFGPALGGFVMAWVGDLAHSYAVGAAALFYLTAAGYAANFLFLYSIRLRGVMSVEKASVIKSMAAGLQFIWQNPIFGILIAMTYFSQFFGWSFQSLFPVFAKDILHVGPDGLGYMNSALGAGSLLGAGLSTGFANVRRRGWLILGGLISQGVILALFAQAPSFAIALGPLVLAGISQSMFNVTAQSTLQYLVPNEYRGRVMGVWGMTYTAVQPSGQLAMGVLAGLASAPWAVTLGGALVLSFTLLVAMTSRRIRSLTLSEPLGPRQVPTHP